MGHLDYYRYQTAARGVSSAEDVARIAADNAYVYDRLVLPWLPPTRNVRIVDLACGHGSFLWWLRQRGFTSARGVDSAPTQIESARTAELDVVEADVMQWLEAVPSGSLDVLVAIDFIEHISKDDFVRFLKGARAALAPGGRLILRYPNGDSPFVGLNLFNDITHVWTYTTNCLDTLARWHGFTEIAFADEGIATIADRRWLKVPLGRAANFLLRGLIRAASREHVKYLSSCIWACLRA